jgi:hypothetical protein
VPLDALTAARVRTAAGPHGVMVRFGVLGLPRCTYRLEQIARSEVIDLPVWAVVYGFWWTPSRMCYTVRPPAGRASDAPAVPSPSPSRTPHAAVAVLRKAAAPAAFSTSTRGEAVVLLRDPAERDGEGLAEQQHDEPDDAVGGVERVVVEFGALVPSVRGGDTGHRAAEGVRAPGR